MDNIQFEQIVKRYRQPVFSVLRKMVHSPDSAMDLAQDVFVRLWTAKVNPVDDRSLFTYIYRIAIDHLRHHKQKMLELDETSPVLAYSPADDSEIYDIVHRCSAKLKSKQKAVFVLRDIEGFSFEEIGRILKMPLNNVRSNLHLARKNIRKILQDNYQISAEDIYDL